jgi:hypothetical protein
MRQGHCPARVVARVEASILWRWGRVPRRQPHQRASAESQPRFTHPPPSPGGFTLKRVRCKALREVSRRVPPTRALKSACRILGAASGSGDREPAHYRGRPDGRNLPGEPCQPCLCLGTMDKWPTKNGQEQALVGED